MRIFLAIKIFFHFTLAVVPQIPLNIPESAYGPSRTNAISNANLIFNAVYSSMRQWGSSIYHNGMSFYHASIPKGTLLYHGDRNPGPPAGPEWLAFEIPHAEIFAGGVQTMKKSSQVIGQTPHDIDKWEVVGFRNMTPVQRWAFENDQTAIFDPGYFQTYQANRDLRLLYIDGMAASNSPRGTLDSQDILLLNFTGGLMDEWPRAKELCALGQTIGVEGFIRMEGGFELIKCNFSDGLDLLSSKRRPDVDAPEALNSMFLFGLIQDVASRYHDIGGGRVRLDYSSMISALFYPADLSNPDLDPRQAKLPRLVHAGPKVLEQIRSDLKRGFNSPRSGISVDWQGVADMIVKRFAPRLKFMASALPREQFLSQVNTLLSMFITFEAPEQSDPVKVCARHYLQPVQLLTEVDYLLEAAFTAVMYKTCSTLYQVRQNLLAKKDESSTETETALIRELNIWLDWSDWITCGECAIDQVCFIAMFPWGSPEDHYSPRCRNSTELKSIRHTADNYWGVDWALMSL